MMKSLLRSLLLFSTSSLANELGKRQQSSFISCVGSIGGTLTPSNATYKNESQPFNLRFDYNPQAIFFPTSAKEVSQVVTCASQSNLSISTRSGGHSYAGYALAADTVIDMSKMKGFSSTSDGTAVIQTGNKLGDVATKLWDNGKRALPHGVCPYVGTGGHAAYGGFGFFSRMAGLLQDNIKEAEVVLANGTIAVASTTKNSDLFWALRGAGPSFGLVTSWTFSTHPAPTTVVDFTITFGLLNQSDFLSALVHHQAFGHTAPKELAVRAVMGSAGTGFAEMLFQGDYYGSMDEFHKVIDGWISGLPANRVLNATSMSWLDSLVAKYGPLSVKAPDVHDTFFAKSLIVSEPTSNDTLSAFVDYIYTTGTTAKNSWFVEIESWGGQIAQLTTSDTSFAHRNAAYGYQLYSSSTAGLPPYPDSQIDFVHNMWAALSGNDSTAPAYTNYIDPTLSSEDWPKAYYGVNGTFERLVGIKKSVDPGNVFRFAQSIPLSLDTSGSANGTTTTPGSAGPSSTSGTGTGAPQATQTAAASARATQVTIVTLVIVLLACGNKL